MENSRKILKALELQTQSANASTSLKYNRVLHMDLSNGEGMIGCSSTKKLKTNSDENKDYISDLPDSILVHILSFLPIRDAINTIFLRRFGNLWGNISVLDLNECLYHHHICRRIGYNEFEAIHYEKFAGFFGNVLDHHETCTLDKLRLKMSFVAFCSEEYDDPDLVNHLEKVNCTIAEIDKLIGYGISRNVKVLDLDFRGCSNYRYQSLSYNMPDVFRSNHLRELRLVTCNARFCRNVCLKSLRVLLLEEVELSDETMEKILIGCPFLEDLSLVECHGIQKLNCNNQNLKKMMLRYYEFQELIISSPYLLFLELAGQIEYAVLQDVSSLVDASIIFHYLDECEQRAYEDVQELLQKFCLCKTLTLCTWCVLVFAIWNFRNAPSPSFKWKNLILHLNLTESHHLGISLLLRSCPSLEALTMYIYPPHEYSRDLQGMASEWIEDHDFDGENYWNSQEETFPHLKTVMIYGYINEPYVMQMVEFLLRSAVGLEKMVISTKESFEPTHQSEIFIDAIERQKDYFNSEQLLKLSSELLSFPRSSSQAVILFS